MIRFAKFGIQRIAAILIGKFSYFMSFEFAIFVHQFLSNIVGYSATSRLIIARFSDCLPAVKVVVFNSDVD